MEPTDNNSYLNWNPESSLGFNAPDSCCIPLEDLLDDSAQKGCGMCVHHENPARCKQDVNARDGRVLANNPELPNKIWMNSCVYILVGRVKREVQPYLWSDLIFVIFSPQMYFLGSIFLHKYNL